MIVSLAIHIDCFACASRFLSAILARSRPYLRRQLSCHTIDTMLSACLLWLHAPSLCIEGHVPTSYCISTDLSALLTPEIRNHHANLIKKNYTKNCVLLSFQSFPCTRQRCINDVLFFQGPFDKLQGLLGKIQGLFKDLNKFLRTFQGVDAFSRTIQGQCEPCIMWQSLHSIHDALSVDVFSQIKKSYRFEPRSNIPQLKMIIWVTDVLKVTVVDDWHFDNLCGSHLQSQAIVWTPITQMIIWNQGMYSHNQGF